MKKILFFFAGLLITTISIPAQNTVDFKLQENSNFINVLDGKSYSVITYDGKSQSELYSMILTSITKLYNSPKDVISKVENEIISVNGICTDYVIVKTPGMKMHFAFKYILKFQFKDGKVRIDAPIVSQMISQYEPSSYTKPFQDWVNSWKIFKNGTVNPKRQDTANYLNNKLNSLINNILSSHALNDEW